MSIFAVNFLSKFSFFTLLKISINEWFPYFRYFSINFFHSVAALFDIDLWLSIQDNSSGTDLVISSSIIDLFVSILLSSSVNKVITVLDVFSLLRLLS